MMAGLWQRGQAWLRDRLRVRFRTEFVEEDPPERPLARTLYVVTEDGAPWGAAMFCPCGCGETLHLNLLPDERPVWTLAVDVAGFGTLHPSVHRMKGCRAHFWFRAGKVHWCGDQESPLLRDIRLLLGRWKVI